MLQQIHWILSLPQQCGKRLDPKKGLLFITLLQHDVWISGWWANLSPLETDHRIFVDAPVSLLRNELSGRDTGPSISTPPWYWGIETHLVVWNAKSEKYTRKKQLKALQLSSTSHNYTVFLNQQTSTSKESSCKTSPTNGVFFPKSLKKKTRR